MKILHIAETAQGGVGTYIAELASLQIAAFGAQSIRVLAPEQHKLQLAKIAPQSLLTYDRPGRTPGALSLLGRATSKAVADFQPDVIHLHSSFAGLIVRAMYGLRRTRPALIYCPHGWAFDIQGAAWKRGLVKLAERILGGLCDKIIAISKHEAYAARRIGIPASKIELVLNGLIDVEPTMADLPTDRKLQVLFVGRLDRQKGYDVLLDAVAPLSDRIRISVAGEAVVDAADGAGDSETIRRLGWLSPEAIREHLASTDVLVVPSRWEGFGLVAIEAMRAGKMVIASGVGGLPEIVQHGVTGWLVEPDRPDELGQLLQRAMGAERKRMGDNGRLRFLAHFTAERMHRQIFDVYRRCVRRAIGMPGQLAR